MHDLILNCTIYFCIIMCERGLLIIYLYCVNLFCAQTRTQIAFFLYPSCALRFPALSTDGFRSLAGTRTFVQIMIASEIWPVKWNILIGRCILNSSHQCFRKKYSFRVISLCIVTHCEFLFLRANSPKCNIF